MDSYGKGVAVRRRIFYNAHDSWRDPERAICRERLPDGGYRLIFVAGAPFTAA